MNDRHTKSLEQPYITSYGRLTNSIDIKQFQRFYESSPYNQTNPFLNYALTNKQDLNSYQLPKKTQQISYQTLIQRITDSLNGAVKNKKVDNLVVDTMFRMLDGDGDGYIGIQDVLAMRGELGLGEGIDKEGIGRIMEKVSEEGDRLDKKEFMEIFWL